MTLVYLDSSVLVAIALGDPRGAQALAIIGSRDSCTSALSPVECQAGLSFQYATGPGGLPAAEQSLDAILDRVQIIQITASVLIQARTLVRRHRSGIGLRTLDAIHVASCGEIRGQVGGGAIEYITSDRRQHVAFTSEGFSGAFLP
ncbi:MAG TPA: type II toxin-antitoxin system VapC family toxin [Candidatus Acidoferrales bacterium]|nr:type II toxin-antitoxin system VapC family toxin [Candidatus Acidoferrales bacterium]